MKFISAVTRVPSGVPGHNAHLFFTRLVTCALLTGCGGAASTSSTVDSGGDSQSCARLRFIDARTGEPTPFAITTAFLVTTCDGHGVADLSTDQFEVLEDGKPIVAKESSAVILPRTAEPYLTVVLDNTPTVRESGAVDTLVDGALELVDSLTAAAPNARISVVWFSLTTDVRQDFTTNAADAKAAIEAYRTAQVGTPSTNLYGAIIDSVSHSATAQQARKDAQRGGVLTLGNIVVFTDGADNAAVRTLEDVIAATESSSDEVQLVGLKNSDELDEASFRKLGNTNAIVVTTVDQLKVVFQSKAEQIASLTRGVYVLGYCTPKAAGIHSVTLSLATADDPVKVNFDAGKFAARGGPTCGTKAFEDACEGLGCGGLWCGGCRQTCKSDNLCECEASFAGPTCGECAITGMAMPSCTTCLPAFAGEACDRCADPHMALPTCAICLPEFTGPDCSECSNPRMALPGCNACKPEFAGDDCAACASLFTGNDCNVCANPSASGPECSVCLPGLAGENCDVCSNPNMALPTCTACKPGFAGPACGECSNPRKTLPSCTSCKSGFAGADCTDCDNPNKALPGCTSCKTPFSGETCDECTNPNMQLPSCTSCKPQYAGVACDICSNPLKALPDCAQCTPPLSGPSCSDCQNPNYGGPSCENVKFTLDFAGGEGVAAGKEWNLKSGGDVTLASGVAKSGKWTETALGPAAGYVIVTFFGKDGGLNTLTVTVHACGKVVGSLPACGTTFCQSPPFSFGGTDQCGNP